MCKELITPFALLLLIVSGAGCATIVNGTTEKIQLRSDPVGAEAMVDGAHEVTTPTTVELSRGDTHSITFHKEGYQDQTQYLTSSESGWVWGNVLLGGIAGAVADEDSGASKKLSSDVVSVRLIPQLATAGSIAPSVSAGTASRPPITGATESEQ
jgi:PEGA domain